MHLPLGVYHEQSHLLTLLICVVCFFFIHSFSSLTLDFCVWIFRLSMEQHHHLQLLRVERPVR